MNLFFNCFCYYYYYGYFTRSIHIILEISTNANIENGKQIKFQID